MKLLASLIKYALYILVLAVIAALLTLLSWWMRWPLFTGISVMLACAGCVLLFLALRGLWRWRSKKQFVRTVLDRQRNSAVDTARQGSSLRTAWQAGMDVLNQSPRRFRDSVTRAQPWYLALDDTKSLSPLFSTSARSVPPYKEQPALCWYYFPSSIVLQTTSLPQQRPAGSLSTGEENADWEEMLTLLAEQKHIPFHGLLFMISAADLTGENTGEIRIRSLRLREAAQQVMLTLGKYVPVYILIQDLSAIEGMSGLLDRLPAQARDTGLGHIFPVQPGSAGAGVTACHAATAQLGEMADSLAAQGEMPRGKDLRALEALKALDEKLDILLQGICGEMPHQLRPLLRGVFFADSPRENDNLPAATDSPFVRSFIGGVLPENLRPVAPLAGRFSLYASTRVLCFCAWLALTLGTCGLMAVSTIYQCNTLRQACSLTQDNISHLEQMNTLYRQMNCIIYLEKARDSWLLPVVGQDALQRALVSLKADYIARVFQQVLFSILETDRAILDNPGSPQSQCDDVTRELYWLISVMMDKLTENKIDKNIIPRYPLTGNNQQSWTVFTGTIVANAITWTEDHTLLEGFTQNLRHLITTAVNKNHNILERWYGIFDDRHTNIQKCLSDYWVYLPKGSESDMCIAPRYTETGQKYTSDFIDDIKNITESRSDEVNFIEKMRQQYWKNYAEAWRQFILNFDRGWRTNFNSKQYTDFFNIQKTSVLPQIQLLQDAARALIPLQKNMTTTPRWVEDIILLNAMSTVALSGDGDKKENFWSSLLSTLMSSPEILSELRRQSGSTAELRQLLQGTGILHQYFLNTRLILQQISNPPDALPLAQQLYNNKKPASSAGQKDPYGNALKALAAVQPSIGGKDGAAGHLLAGMLQFAGHGALIQAGNELQDMWSTEVLGSFANLKQQKDPDVLYGEKGVVSGFVTTHLTPFISRNEQGIFIKSWDNTPFPFTEDFLTSLTRAANIAAAPAQESYTVLLRTSPTLVNTDATLHPDSTAIITGDGQQLVNRNYPKQAQFTCRSKEPAGAALEIRFPAFTLRCSYANLVDLISDFETGSYTFKPEDFPDAQKRLEEAAVKEITVRIIADNAAPLLRQLSLEVPVLQERITYTW